MTEIAVVKGEHGRIAESEQGGEEVDNLRGSIEKEVRLKQTRKQIAEM